MAPGNPDPVLREEVERAVCTVFEAKGLPDFWTTEAKSGDKKAHAAETQLDAIPPSAKWPTPIGKPCTWTVYMDRVR